jgi:uncharacterized protein (DUF305 family)
MVAVLPASPRHGPITERSFQMYRLPRAALAALVPAMAFSSFIAPASAAQEATPPMISSTCESIVTASPMVDMSGMAMGTPDANEHTMTGMSVEFDQLYIDMMMPHHQSIIAMAQAARDRLADERLIAIAENIINSQQAETVELQELRETWYGSPDAMPMDEAMMGMMMEELPGMGAMAAMQQMMDPHALVEAFCAGEDPDLAFIDLTIPHHEMAIAASEAAREQATHEEIRTIAERVIQAQQQEIDTLQKVRAELAGEATPGA